MTYNFSTPYYEDAVGLLVKKAAGFKGLADMNGKAIGVAQSATSKEAVQKSADELGVYRYHSQNMQPTPKSR